MTKILDRYIFRELLSPFLIGLAVLTFVFLMSQIIDLARTAIKGGVPLHDVMQVLYWSLPHLLALTIPMALLVAANLGLGRMSSDNEIVVLHASGVGLLRIGRSLLLFACLATVVTGYVLMRLVPQANLHAKQLIWEMAKRQLHQGIKEKEFFEHFAGYVIYVGHIDDDTGAFANIMVADSTRPQEPRLTLARKGRMLYSEAQQYVVLEMEDGESFAVYDEKPEQSSRSTFQTERYVFPLDNFMPQTSTARSGREMNMRQLAEEIVKRKEAGQRWWLFAVEWHKKLSIPAACLVFGVIGLALGARLRTRARAAGSVVSLAVILVYYILLTSGERMGDQGQIPPWLSMWSPNLLIGGLGIVMLWLAAREIDLGIWDKVATAGVHIMARGSHLLAGKRQVVIESEHQHEESLPASANGPTARRRKTIVIRIPRLSPDFPRILDRYTLVQWVRTFGIGLLAITAFYIIMDLSRIIADINENNVPGRTVVEYYEYSLPNIFFLMLGPTALVASLFILGVMNRNNEIIAMKASGISVYRIIMPVALVAALLSGISFFVNDRIIPVANREALKRRDEITKGPKRSHEYNFGNRWMWGKNNRTLYNYRRYDADSGLMERIKVFDFDQGSYTLRRIVSGARATWVAARGGWQFEDAWVRRFGKSESSPFRRYDAVIVPYAEDPEYFVAEKKAADELNYQELKDYIASLENAGFPARSLHVSLAWKLSLPFVPLVMTAIGIPFALRIGKRGNLFGVFVSVAVIVAFWACVAAFRPLGETGVFPAWLSAWAPNILFGVFGVYMLLTLDT